MWRNGHLNWFRVYKCKKSKEKIKISNPQQGFLRQTVKIKPFFYCILSGIYQGKYFFGLKQQPKNAISEFALATFFKSLICCHDNGKPQTSVCKMLFECSP